ncbi:hypothetical protein F5Y16DRAFT_134536 [Xylariaceae sp. FL0255]|nr:hypothetical protein F5Y16DRAFT_134536 [Xylariaceae sp. FL0255]
MTPNFHLRWATNIWPMTYWPHLHRWRLWTSFHPVFPVIRKWAFVIKDFLWRMFQWSYANTPAQSPLAKSVEDYRAGYPRLCALMEAHEGFMVCRRFTRMRARLLLLKQDRISCLEEQLDKVDREEALPLFLGKSRGDPNIERLSILSRIDASLADYDSFLERSTKVLKYTTAFSRDRFSLMNWLSGNGCVSRLETAYLEYDKDLVSLTGPRDRATSQLENWVEDVLIEHYPKFRTLPSHTISTDENVYIYSGSLIKRTARILLFLVISILLLLPIIVCTVITSLMARLFIVVISTAIYLAILSALTRARTFELILAGATFMTILVVFVSNTGSTVS